LQGQPPTLLCVLTQYCSSAQGLQKEAKHEETTQLSTSLCVSVCKQATCAAASLQCNASKL
jgi:hypothetical protein